MYSMLMLGRYVTTAAMAASTLRWLDYNNRMYRRSFSTK